MSKWPKPYTDEKEPPDRIYLGFDEEKGKQTVTWWIWPTSDDDVCYIRRDLVLSKIKEIQNADREYDSEMGKESTEA